jgi:hypothetical protein
MEEPSRRIWKLREASGSFGKLLEASGSFWKLLGALDKCFGGFFLEAREEEEKQMPETLEKCIGVACYPLSYLSGNSEALPSSLVIRRQNVRIDIEEGSYGSVPKTDSLEPSTVLIGYRVSDLDSFATTLVVEAGING